MCEICWETAKAVSAPPPFCEEQRLVSNFEKEGSEKNEYLGWLKSSFHRYIPGGRGGGGGGLTVFKKNMALRTQFLMLILAFFSCQTTN